MYRTAKDATITHREIEIGCVFHQWDRELKNRYPHHTRQGYDFYMNLGMYCKEFN